MRPRCIKLANLAAAVHYVKGGSGAVAFKGAVQPCKTYAG